MHRPPLLRTPCRLGILLRTIVLLAAFAPAVCPAGPVESSGVRGGLIVVVGARGAGMAIDAVQSGPFLIQVLDRVPSAVAEAQEAIRRAGLYGMVSVDLLGPEGKLPYAENLVNLVIVADPGAAKPCLAEAVRVLCPDGVLLASGESVTESDLQAAGLEAVRGVGPISLTPGPSLASGRGEVLPLTPGKWLAGRKPWPGAMDWWTHPRHGPDGNTVSLDTAVGPPRRVRWVAGPPQEISNFVSAGGRNYYAGVLARDAFNGLRLWEKSLKPSPARGGFSFRFEPGSVRPIADGTRVFVVDQQRLMALDGATGAILRDYPEAGTPLDVLLCGQTLLAFDARSIRAVDAQTGALRWRHDAPEPRYPAAGDGSLYVLEGGRAKGASCEAVALDLAQGTVRWRRQFPWLTAVRGCVYHRGLVAYEISTLNDDKPGNLVQVVSAADGAVRWSHTFVPGMAHMKQARAMFAGDLLWLLDDKKCVGIDPATGRPQRQYQAGWGHCFPPIATTKYLFAGEMDLTDLETGQLDANRITKGACSRDAGFVVANGLIYTAPKHCVCWPMLRDYTALAPARPGG
ncbi:MAG: PQQ-binding-like beta-propeller repeat protein, partial [Thermoguttaceae bacterium]|nr:PQQ-binding-like beta-propeller repeat protein [Thermoguttaceae bacterium]